MALRRLIDADHELWIELAHRITRHLRERDDHTLRGRWIDSLIPEPGLDVPDHAVGGWAWIDATRKLEFLLELDERAREALVRGDLEALLPSPDDDGWYELDLEREALWITLAGR